MRRRFPWLLYAALLVLPASCEPPADPLDPRLEVVASGLAVPWSMGFAPDGRIFIAERLGDIRVVVDGLLATEPWATLQAHDATVQGYEMGLMGLALDPEFATSPSIYVCYTYEADESTHFNRVSTLREDQAGRGQETQVLIDSIPAGPYHNGCRLAFGPDGMLYITTGDAQSDSTAQVPGELGGKILRIRPDGGIPADNPYPGSPVWSTGHRNPQGIAWDSAQRMYVSDHGTTGANGEYDELNHVVRGGNYGWPLELGTVPNPRFTPPLTDSHLAPSGMTFVRGQLYPAWSGRLLIGGLSSTGLYLASTHLAPVLVERVPWVQVGRIRDVMQGPDGHIYLLTSNRDGRGRAQDDDDKLLRILQP